MNHNVLRKSFDEITRHVQENPIMVEDELYNVMERSGFFDYLGYKQFGKDVRKQFVIVGERKKADYACLDEYQNVIFVMEAKKPSDKRIEDALDQLWERYVMPLKARYGVLTNGSRFIIYKRKIGGEYEKTVDAELSEISSVEIDQVFDLLRKPEYDVTFLPKLREYFGTVETLSLKVPLAKQYFFETFELSPDSVFGILIEELLKLFDWTYPKSKFLDGAYGYWRRSLARKPEKLPDSWKPFLKEGRDVFKLMFCLETAHALLARLILAKTCEDLRFPGVNISTFIMEKIQKVRDQIPVLGYPITVVNLLKEMRDQLIYSIFEEDIFSWWTDAFDDFANKSSAELLQEKVDRVLYEFGQAVARLVFVLYKFDFSEIAGDPLGDLYQQYFDKETRKALGEFYTPVEVADYILDRVEYKNMRHKRLIDPACGSGTFLVEALKRYLEEMKSVAKKDGWASVLRELCNNPKIVGLDIHPFACLIAQTRFMMELIPFYKEALEEGKHEIYESLQRLPIFRTDSLVVEMKIQEFQKAPTLLDTGMDLKFKVVLPLRTGEDKLISADIVIPSWKKTAANTEYNLLNMDEYFCVIQGIFDAVKSIARVKGEAIPEKSLEAYLKKYFRHMLNKDFAVLSRFFKPYADRMLSEYYRLESEFEDGRLVKSIEDTVLAAILKNYIDYDFVVGNPPYLNVRIIKSMFGKGTESHYKNVYETANGLYDLYCLFIEKGVNVLSKAGKLGYICSDQFLLTDYGKYLRKFLIKRTKIEHILDFRDSGVFTDVTNYPCIIILSKAEKKALESNKIKFVRVFKSAEDILDSIKNNYRKEEHWADSYDLYSFSQSDLTEDTWKIMPKSEQIVFEKIQKVADARFKQITEDIFVGTQTSADDVYLVFVKKEVDKKLLVVNPQRNEQEYVIEREILKPLLKGKDVTKWTINWSKHWLVFPYHGTRLISENEMKTKYPNAWAYLEKHREIIEDRENGKMRGRADWYGYIYPKNHDKFEQIKIISQLLSTSNRFALDVSGKFFFIAVGGDCISLKEDYKDLKFYKYILGLLNSKVLEYYLKHISPVHSGGFYLYIKQYLEDFPIVLPSTKQKQDIANQITSLVEKILRKTNPMELIDDFLQGKYAESRSAGAEFDIVKFSFTHDHASLRPILSGQSGRAYVIYPSEGEDPVWVDTKEKADFVAMTLRNRSVRKGDRIEVLVPRDNARIVEMLTDLRKELASIDMESVGKLEEEIDALVYALYNIDKDRAVIEDFLKKF